MIAVRYWFQNMMYRFQGWMYGRYGNDELNKALFITSLVLLVLSYFPYLFILWPAALAVMVWANVRCFSKNIYKHQSELEAYRRLTGKWRTWFSLRRRMWRERKTHCYFKCRHCGAMLRVSKGRGQVEVGCPRCKGVTAKRT